MVQQGLNVGKENNQHKYFKSFYFEDLLILITFSCLSRKNLINTHNPFILKKSIHQSVYPQENVNFL